MGLRACGLVSVRNHRGSNCGGATIGTLCLDVKNVILAADWYDTGMAAHLAARSEFVVLPRVLCPAFILISGEESSLDWRIVRESVT